MLTINLDDELTEKLQKQAQNKGHTLEQEITEILRNNLTQENPNSFNLAQRITQRFSDLEEVEIPVIARDTMRQPPNFK
jgi:plasmid stability protein